MQDLSKIIFINLAQDEQELRNFHTGSSKHAMGEAELDKKGPAYWNRHVRRMVQPPEKLKPALEMLIEKYRGPAGLDSQGRPLLTEATTQVLAAVEQLIDAGSFCGEQRVQHWCPTGPNNNMFPNILLLLLCCISCRPLQGRQDVHRGAGRTGPHEAIRLCARHVAAGGLPPPPG
jgi:hypothetical protein